MFRLDLQTSLQIEFVFQQMRNPVLALSDVALKSFLNSERDMARLHRGFFRYDAGHPKSILLTAPRINGKHGPKHPRTIGLHQCLRLAGFCLSARGIVCRNCATSAVIAMTVRPSPAVACSEFEAVTPRPSSVSLTN